MERQVIATGRTPAGPWVLEAWREWGMRRLELRHPESPEGHSRGWSAVTPPAVVPFVAAFRDRFGRERPPLLWGYATVRAATVRFDADSGATARAPVWSIAGDADYGAFLVELDDPGEGVVVALDAGGAPVGEARVTSAPDGPP